MAKPVHRTPAPPRETTDDRVTHLHELRTNAVEPPIGARPHLHGGHVHHDLGHDHHGHGHHHPASPKAPARLVPQPRLSLLALSGGQRLLLTLPVILLLWLAAVWAMGGGN